MMSDEGYDELEELRKSKDAAYEERNHLVALLARLFPSGLAKTVIEGWSEEWHNCVYIDLPTGQASWHVHDSQMFLFEGLPSYAKEWDRHTTEEKYDRISKLVADIAQGVVRSDRIAMTTVYGTEMSCPEHGKCPTPGTCVFKRSCDGLKRSDFCGLAPPDSVLEAIALAALILQPKIVINKVRYLPSRTRP
jgi:hypothetical protein